MIKQSGDYEKIGSFRGLVLDLIGSHLSLTVFCILPRILRADYMQILLIRSIGQICRTGKCRVSQQETRSDLHLVILSCNVQHNYLCWKCIECTRAKLQRV